MGNHHKFELICKAFGCLWLLLCLLYTIILIIRSLL
jgi:hypothetical protein